MCRSAAEGGQRCHSHANNLMIRAYAAYEAAERSYEAHPTADRAEEVAVARDQFVRAQQDLASTRTGMAKVKEMIANPDAPVEAREHGRALLKAGEYLRERNAALGRANRDVAAGAVPFGGTGDEHVDWAVKHASALIAANPEGFRRAPEHRMAKVKTYATAQEQQAGLAARMRTLRSAAQVFAERHSLVETTASFERGLGGLHDAAGADPTHHINWLVERDAEVRAQRRARDEVATEVLLLAHRYAQAKEQTPPDAGNDGNSGTWTPGDGERVWLAVDGDLVRGRVHHTGGALRGTPDH